MTRVRWLLLVCLAGCGVRAPRPIDVRALVAARGPVEARRALELRAIEDRRDVAARLALAALDEQQQRPTAALEALEQVVALGGPLGVRWRGEDQARLARLLAGRGRARLARGAASAAADLARARQLGAAITAAELTRARVAGALTQLRHADGETRHAGRRTLAELAAGPALPPGLARGQSPGLALGVAPGRSPDLADDLAPGLTDDRSKDLVNDLSNDERAAWQGALPGAGPAARGRFGAWLWDQGARRAAWDELAAWRARRVPPGDPALEDAYARAARWWTPLDQPAPGGPLVGAARCAFGGCAPGEVAGENLLERAYLTAPLAAKITDPADAAAVAVIALHQALRGEVSWGPAIAARVDLAAFAEPGQLARLPGAVQPVFARLAGLELAVPAPDADAPADQRLVLAAERVLAGGSAADIAPLVGDAPYAEELRRVAEPRPPFAGVARSDAAVRAVGLSLPGVLRPDAIRAIAGAYARDPAIADRLVRDAVAAAPDDAIAHAAAGAVFDALGDPSRARTAWQAAVDASPEPALLRGLAEAIARHGDGDAALIAATSAAASSGDPGVVWLAVARALAGAGRPVHALDAARSALDLATGDTVEAAYDIAIDASRALDRDAQVAQLIAQRARFAQTALPTTDRDPTDARGALEAYRQHPTGATIARLWVAARWNPRAVEPRAALLAATTPDDPRHAVIVGELVDLAGDRDPSVRRAAVAALR
ncbi:MAG TPA: hypothetical protein VGC42_25285 [Kofleriaceae bacterium]